MSEVKLSEIRTAIDDGANELDVVMNISAFKSKMDWAKIDLAKCSKVIHDNGCFMKVIIETAYLSKEEILSACKICKEIGSDFVKTSTGFASEGATTANVKIMRETLPSNIGVKASGGIKDFKTAVALIDAGADRLGVSAGVSIFKEAQEEFIKNGKASEY